MSREELRWRTVKRVIYAPGSQPSFLEGLYAEDIIFEHGFPDDTSRIEARWDAGTKTIRLFLKKSEVRDEASEQA